MFCNECGAKNPDDAKFCNNCGEKLVSKETVENKTPIITNPKVMPKTQVPYHDPINVSNEEISKLFDKETAKAFMEEQDKKWHKETESEKEAYANAYNGVTNNNVDDIPEYTDDLDDEEDEALLGPSNSPSVEDALKALSTSKNKVNPVELVGNKSSDIPLIDDHYFDDVLPEIDNEIYSIPKENIVKVIISVIGLLVIMGWLIYWLS